MMKMLALTLWVVTYLLTSQLPCPFLRDLCLFILSTLI